MIKRLGL